MSADGQQSTIDEIGRTASSAARIGAEAAKAGKAVSKAAAQAASGNLAGAAATVFTNQTTRRALIITVLVPIITFFTVCILFLYALPTAIYAELTSYFADVQEEWNVEVYGSDRDVAWESAWASFRAGGKVVTDAVEGVWNAIVNFFSSTENSETGSGNALSDDGTELMVTVDEGAQQETTRRKVDACLNKLNSRAEQIASGISQSKGSLAEAVVDAFNSNGQYRWFDVNISVSHGNADESDAITLLSLYTVQTAGSVENLRTSDFMKWLGWYDSRDTSPVYFQPVPGFNVSASVKGWNGTFMPQYLVEQQKQELAALEEEDDQETHNAITAKYENKMAPATDLLLFIEAPSLSEISDLIIVTQHDDRTPIYETVVNEETGEEEEYVVDYDHDIYESAEVTFHIEVGFRSAADLIEVAGLWPGGFQEGAE